MYSHILLAIDPDSVASHERALPAAIGLAEAHGATLHIMTVVPDYGSSLVASYFPRGFEKKAMAHARDALKALVAARLPATLPHQLVVAHGRIYKEICRVAEEVHADLVVMASHKPATRDLVLAPNAQQVLLHTPVSVLIVR